MYAKCACGCGKTMWVSEDLFITPAGLISNVAGKECLKRICNADIEKPEPVKDDKKYEHEEVFGQPGI